MLLPEFRHDAGIDANKLPLVDETEELEALALELLVVVAFLVTRFVAMAESVVNKQSNMGAHLMHSVFVVMCVGPPLVFVLRILVVAFLVFVFTNLKVDLLTFIIVLEVST